MRLFNGFRRYLKKRQLWDVFLYLFFGGLSTVVNIVVFDLSLRFGASWQVANFLSWFFAVAFAFVTNKLWVFASHSESLGAAFWELCKFVFARVVSLGLDYLCMYLMISVMSWSNLVAKIITQVVVVIANYAFSKFIIFTGGKTE